MSATVDQIADRKYEQRYGCGTVNLPAQPLPAHDAPVGVTS